MGGKLPFKEQIEEGAAGEGREGGGGQKLQTETFPAGVGSWIWQRRGVRSEGGSHGRAHHALLCSHAWR